MIVTPIKTDPIVLGALLFPVLDQFLPPLHNGDIVAITSKIISICEGRIQAITTEEEKQRVIREESERYIDTELTRRYGFQLTIAHNILIPNAGVDESNGNGQLILWPKVRCGQLKKSGNIFAKNSPLPVWGSSLPTAIPQC